MTLQDIKLEWGLTVDKIKQYADEVIAESNKTVEDIIAVQGERTLENTVYPLSDLMANTAARRTSCDFPQHISPDKAIRDASAEADKIMSTSDVELFMRVDLYQAFEDFASKTDLSTLAEEDARFVKRLLRDFKRNGLHLDEAKRGEIKDIKKRESDIGIEFSKNLVEENTTFQFSTEELAGMPDDFIKRLKVDDATGKHIVTLQYPDVIPIRKHASNPETRRRLSVGFDSRGMKTNTALLEELVRLRQRKADILGYKTHADYITEVRMSGSQQSVADFLSELSQKLTPLADKERDAALVLKEEDCKKNNLEFDGKLNMWDFNYYLNMIEERDFNISHEEIREYFPVDVVTKGLLEMYQTLLGLVYAKVEDPGDMLYHPDVPLYRVTDKSSGDDLGYFYLDLHPRPNKYSHAACFGLQPGCRKSDGARLCSVAAMVANFSAPTADKPSLLLHSEVETYFHEFGHVMHQLCGQTRHRLFSGTAVERDFVEAPSQMLENWCWEPEPLKMMSGHFQDKSKPLPDELITKLIASRNANAGLLNKRQVTLASFDQHIHTRGQADTQAVYADLCQSILGIPAIEGTNMPASFGHLAGGYDAQYYGYLWSEVFSADMFGSRFKTEGVMSAKTGADYRRYILGPGGSRDAADMLKDFLGREPSQAAFLKAKGLQ